MNKNFLQIYIFLIFALINVTSQNSNAQDVVIKPIKIEELLKRVDEFLSRCDKNKIPSKKYIDLLIKKSKSCKRDTDCVSLFIGDIPTKYGCMTIPLNINKFFIVSEAIDKNHQCANFGSCILRDYCSKNPAVVSCKNGKCRY